MVRLLGGTWRRTIGTVPYTRNLYLARMDAVTLEALLRERVAAAEHAVDADLERHAVRSFARLAVARGVVDREVDAEPALQRVGRVAAELAVAAAGRATRNVTMVGG